MTESLGMGKGNSRFATGTTDLRNLVYWVCKVCGFATGTSDFVTWNGIRVTASLGMEYE